MAAVDESTDRRAGRRVRWRAVLALGCAVLPCLTVNACTAPVGYPDRATVLSTGTADLDRLLADRHGSGAWWESRVEGPCQGRDSAHGSLVLSAGPLRPLSAAQGEALLAGAAATWRAAGYPGVSTSRTASGGSMVAAHDGGFRLDADVEAGGSAEVSVASCYSARGPETQTRTLATIPP
jgi:hypothetical protein